MIAPKLSAVEIRLIPKPLWGLSLASICTTQTWRTIKNAVISPDTADCRFGADAGAHRGKLEGHERWRYDAGYAQLVDIWPLCPACHSIFHPGRTLARHGQHGLQALQKTYAKRAMISNQEAARRYELAFQQHSDYSKHAQWKIDLTKYERYFPLSPKSAARPHLTPHIWVGDPFRAPTGGQHAGLVHPNSKDYSPG